MASKVHKILVAACLVLAMLVSTSEQGLLDAISNTVTCPKYIAECEWDKSSEKDDNDRRVYCCTQAKYMNCVEGKVAEHCPDTPIASLMSINVDTGFCEGYTFWSPECIYTNYMLAVIGSTVGLVSLGVAACLICYCCCCRRK